jgi:IS1 family transposase
MLCSMNRLSLERRAQIVSLLVECCGVNAITRITGVSVHTVLNLLADVGEACQRYQDEHLRGLTSKRIECDEIWAFCYAKQKNVPVELQGKLGHGDVWTWTAIDAETKLVPCWHIGRRDAAAAFEFMTDLASRLTNRVQLTTDGHRAYLSAVDAAFSRDIDYAMLVKIYGASQENEVRYSPATCLGTDKTVIRGRPDPAFISTSYVERQNLTMRMSMRRFARLTNAHSKKLANHRHAVALHFMHYNFARICSSIRCTPAMEAGISSHIWSIEELVRLAD